MSDIRKTTLEFHWMDAKARNDGRVELTFAGMTEGGNQYNFVLLMAPSSVGYIANDLHKVVAALQKDLDNVKSSLRGDA